jgi:hypothetical protein
MSVAVIEQFGIGTVIDKVESEAMPDNIAMARTPGKRQQRNE